MKKNLPSDFDRAWSRMSRDRVAWSVDDWKDLYHTLRAFKLRVMCRRVFGKPDGDESDVVRRILYTRLPRRKKVTE